MPKRTFEIEWPDESGPLWMNRDNLLIALTRTCPNTQFTVQDVTGDDACDPAPRTDGPANPAYTERLRENLRGAMARGYCEEPNATKVLDPDLLESMLPHLVKCVQDS